MIRHALLLVFATCAGANAADVRIIKDISYRPESEPDKYASERCKLDLYLPAKEKGFPCVVWFHGGGLENGSKDGENKWGTTLAEAGIALAAVNYRLSPKAKYPSYIEDAAAAVAWVHGHIAEHGGDPKSVFVAGHSAGGYLTAMVVLDEQWLTAAGMKVSQLAGAIPVSGQMSTHNTVRKERGLSRTEEIVDQAAPLKHIRPDVPPIFFIAGDNDLPGRSADSRRTHDALTEAGSKNSRFQEFKDRDHGSIKNRMVDADDPARLAIIAFIEKYRTK